MSDERNPFDSFIDEPDAIEAVYENLRYLDNLGYVETITDVNGEKICAVRITKKGIVFVEGSLDFNIEAPAFQVDIGEINIISVEDFTLSLKREIEKAGMSEDRKKELLDRLDDITSHPTYNTALSTILSRLPLSPDCT